VLGGKLGALPEVVVALLQAETGETEGGLTTTAVLLGQVDLDLVDDFLGVAADCAVEGAIAVNDNEAELVVLLHELHQGLSVELVVTEIQRGVERLERLKVNVDHLLLALIRQNGATVDHQAIIGDYFTGSGAGRVRREAQRRTFKEVKEVNEVKQHNREDLPRATEEDQDAPKKPQKA